MKLPITLYSAKGLSPGGEIELAGRVPKYNQVDSASEPNPPRKDPPIPISPMVSFPKSVEYI